MTLTKIMGEPLEMRLGVRQAQAGPILEYFRLSMREMAFSLSAKTDVALAYVLERWDALSLYVADGRLAIDNRPAERALRAVALTRKNFLFLCCDEGGRRAAII